MAIEGCCTGNFVRFHGESRLGQGHLCHVTSVPMHTGLRILFPSLSCLLPWCLPLSKSSVHVLTSYVPRQWFKEISYSRRYSRKGAIFIPAKMKVFWEPKLRVQVHPYLHRFCGALMASWSLSVGSQQVTAVTVCVPSLSWPAVPNVHLAQGFSCKGLYERSLLAR